MTLPLISILAQKQWPGLNSLVDRVTPLQVLPVDEALRTHWGTDAHCVTYRVEGPGNPTGDQVRVNKPALTAIRGVGVDVFTTCFGLDYDNPNHEPWTPHSLDEFLAKLQEVAQRWPLAWAWSCFYTTRNGARFLYVLDRPLPCDQAEGKHRWLTQQFREQGIEMDLLSDWTRLFRLPYVMRDGMPTWDDPNTMLIEQWENVLTEASIPSSISPIVQQYGEIIPLQRARPMPDDAQTLLWAYSKSSNRKIMSDWAREAKKKLVGRECFPCIFEHMPLAAPGARDKTLHAYVGQAISMLYSLLPGTTPECVYALFVDPVMQLEPDTNGKDWLDILWDHVLRLWAKEEAKFAAQQVQESQRQETGLSILDQIVEGMKEWCDRAELFASPDIARAFAVRHLIVSSGTAYSIMTTRGYYDSKMIAPAHLVTQVKHMGMDSIIQTQVMAGRTFRSATPTDIINEYSTLVNEVQARACTGGAIVEDMDGPGARLVLEAYRRSNLISPEYNEDVDGWLRAMFGLDYEKVTKWIGWALAFEEGPICALSLQGAAGTGKKMFTEGLTETLQVPIKAGVEELVGEWQYNLSRSPFLFVNENWPQKTKMHPADQFRIITGGDGFKCERKYLPPTMVKNPVRVVFTANNENVVNMLAGNRNLSPDDREALGVRLMHITISAEARLWLNERGGILFTGSPGRRWITGDAGQRSNFLVAKHFLWLYKNRKGPNGKRLLVEGSTDSDIMQVMRTQSGHAPIVIEAIVRMIESPQPREGLTIEDGKVFVLASEILDFFRANLQQHVSEQVTANSIMGVLKSLVINNNGLLSDKAFLLESRKQVGARRWSQIDCELLLAHQQRVGGKSLKLEELVLRQRTGRETSKEPSLDKIKALDYTWKEQT